MPGTIIRNREAEVVVFRRRALVAGLLIVLAFLVLAGRMFWLQVIKRDYFHTLAEANRISTLPVVPNRGLILDRKGEVLAANYSAFTLEVTPSLVANLEKTLDELGAIVDIQPKDRRRLKRLLEESKNFESLPVRNRLTDEEMARFAVNRYRFPGFEIRARLFRNYPQGDVASHAIGYIGRITVDDLKKIDTANLTTNYKGTDHIGKRGVEASYEAELHGRTGSEQVEIDAGGRAIRSLSKATPASGSNLTLTLDIKMQKVIEDMFGERRGAAIAIDPRNGEVLALVSKPGFDPNLFVDGIDPQNWDLLNNSPDKPMLNRALQGTYPPGSTLKPFLALSALESGKRTPSQTTFDPGYFMSADHRFNDDLPGGHGVVDMHKSLVVSCDTYYFQLAAETDIDKTAEFLAKLGFGRKSGIDIDGEVDGVLPSRAWKEKRFARAAADARKWYAGDSVSAGIGQGYNTYTPLQLAHAIAAIANGGIAYRPHLIKQVTDAGTGEVREIKPVIDGTLNVKPENLEIIKSALIGVTREPGGTITNARTFATATYVSAGKTGTAQLFSLKGEKYAAHRVTERLRDHAWYIAYAPADNPTIAIAVLVENGGFGGVTAAPIARAVFDYHLLGKLPDAKIKKLLEPDAKNVD